MACGELSPRPPSGQVRSCFVTCANTASAFGTYSLSRASACASSAAAWVLSIISFVLMNTFRLAACKAALHRAAAQPASETAITLPEKPLTVLVAEDNDLNYEITAEQLRGYRVHCVRTVNGQDCLQRIEQAAPDEFDAILMDMQMPVMNGLEATAAIRKLDSETAKNIPIIALIANAYHEDIQKCLAAGMNAHLSKPINIDRAVRTIIECARTAKENG